MMPRTDPAHGIATADPLLTTTTVFGLTATTSVTSWFWSAGRLMSPRSPPSDSNLLTNTTARSAARAAATAASCPAPVGSAHFWLAPVPQVHTCSGVPLVEALPVASRHRPWFTSVPLELVHFCPAAPVQVDS